MVVVARCRRPDACVQAIERTSDLPLHCYPRTSSRRLPKRRTKSACKGWLWKRPRSIETMKTSWSLYARRSPRSQPQASRLRRLCSWCVSRRPAPFFFGLVWFGLVRNPTKSRCLVYSQEREIADLENEIAENDRVKSLRAKQTALVLDLVEEMSEILGDDVAHRDIQKMVAEETTPRAKAVLGKRDPKSKDAGNNSSGAVGAVGGGSIVNTGGSTSSSSGRPRTSEPSSNTSRGDQRWDECVLSCAHTHCVSIIRRPSCYQENANGKLKGQERA